MLMTPALKKWLVDGDHVVAHANDDLMKRTAARLIVSGELSNEQFVALASAEEPMPTSPDPTKVFGRTHVRVKSPGEGYDEKRAIAVHRKSGTPVMDAVYDREALVMSEGSKARAGVFLKHLARKAGVLQVPASEHEKALLHDVATQHSWAGDVGGEYHDNYAGPQVKALLDDAISGGISITPIEFDSDVLTFPLLSGELYPWIDLKPVPRGRRIESGSIGTPSISWGEADGVETTLFNTADLVDALNTTIFSVRVAIEVGNDFLSDSPVSVGATLTGLIGERLAAELDRIVAIGNGGTEPTGLFNASGVTEMNTENAGAGPPTLADYLNLHFALPKQYRTPAMRVAFISNDTTYARSRAIRVDAASPSTDQRPVIAPLTDVSSYRTLELPHRIQNGIGNGVCGIAALAKYRLYRRQGLEIMWTREGQYLARRNLSLLVATARFGGHLRDTSAMVKWTDGQS